MNRFSYIFLLFPLTFKECLFHALKQKKYNVVAALVFVMDRFTYKEAPIQLYSLLII